MLCLPPAGLLAQGQYDLDSLPPFPDHVQYTHYSDQIGKSPPALPCQDLAPWMCVAKPGTRRDERVGILGLVPGSVVTSLALGAGASLTSTNATCPCISRQPRLL
jgi:hypothetical protein